MNATVKAILVVIIILAFGGGAYAAWHKNASSGAANPSTNTSPAPNSNTTATGNATAPVAATITFSDSGFSPGLTTVKSGDTIRITNTSSQPIQLDSDPHPAHTDDTELNVGEVDAGQTKTFVLTTKGDWGYHDHLNPSFTGRIHVE